tara:strand:- start:245 stop:421 length:177 start_codon:yes stop_codon:yes gene_type:complete
MTDMMKVLDNFTALVLGHIWNEMVDDAQITSRNNIINKQKTQEQNEFVISLALKYINQ